MSANASEAPAATPPRAGARYVIAWIAAWCVFVLPLPFTPRPPMADLPLRAAALAGAGAPLPGTSSGLGAILEQAGRHPLADALSAGAESSLPPAFAARVPYGLALIVLPLAALFYVRRNGGDPWWSLIAFPLTLGYGWWLGWPEVPLGVALALAAAGLAGDPARGLRGAVALAAALALTGLTDPAVFVAAATATAAATLARGGGLSRLGPMLAGAALGAVLLIAAGTGPWTGTDPSPFWARLPALPGALFGTPGDLRAIGYAVILLAGLWATGARARPGVRAWAPCLAAVAVFALWPSSRGLALAGLAALLALGGLVPGTTRRGRLTVCLAVLAWAAVVAVRCTAFTNEARGAEAVLAAVPPGTPLEARIGDPGTDAVPGVPAYRHFAAWYAAEGRGPIVRSGGALAMVRDPAPQGVVRARHRGWALVEVEATGRPGAETPASPAAPATP